MNKSIFKSIGAVVAGFVSVALLSVATDSVVETLGIFPGAAHPELYAPWMLGVAFSYRSVFTLVGGYLTARLAPNNSMRHVYVLMMLGLLGGVAGVISGWSLGNHWYPISLAVTGPLFVWIGGSIYKSNN
jgi:hypothetical protein